MPDSAIALAVRAQKEAIEAADDAILRQLAREWLAVEKALQDKLDLLTDDIYQLKRAGKPVSVGKLYQQARYKALIAQAQEQVARYAGTAANIIAQAQTDMIGIGVQNAQSVLSGVVGGAFDRMSVGSVESMIAATAGMGADGAPLRQLLFERMVLDADGNVLPGVQERLVNTLIQGVTQGWNPKKTAKLMKNDLAQGLEKALVIARTETMRAYRTANAAQMKASGVVEGQMRMCAHTSATCAACLADEGTVYPIDEPLPEHPRGRCVGVPVLEGMAPPKFAKGEEWLLSQDESTQRAILGEKRYGLWKDGTVAFQDFAKQTESPVWGGSVQVASIKSLSA